MTCNNYRTPNRTKILFSEYYMLLSSTDVLVLNIDIPGDPKKYSCLTKDQTQDFCLNVFRF